MHAGLPPGAVPSGVLVANDANRNRLVTVAQRSRRQPRAPLLLIATDARRIPCIKKPRGYRLKFDRILADVPCSGEQPRMMDSFRRRLVFYLWRITNEIYSCTKRGASMTPPAMAAGDGTFRKTFRLWASWGPHDGLGLHTVQLGILKRGLELLAAGGSSHGWWGHPDAV
jgi:hypothetical protein